MADYILPPVLYCFDWDRTLSKDHMHRFLTRKKFAASVENKELGAKVFKGKVSNERAVEIGKLLSQGEFEPSDKAIDTILDLIKKGNHVAITSFSHYPDAIDLQLSKLKERAKERGLSEDQIEKQFSIVTGFPENGITSAHNVEEEPFLGKIGHIELAMQEAIKNGFPKDGHAILFDDSMDNLTLLPERTTAVHADHFTKDPTKTEEAALEELLKAGTIAADRNRTLRKVVKSYWDKSKKELVPQSDDSAVAQEVIAKYQKYKQKKGEIAKDLPVAEVMHTAAVLREEDLARKAAAIGDDMRVKEGLAKSRNRPPPVPLRPGRGSVRP